MVTLLVDGILLRFIRGRGDLDVDVAAKSTPTEWHALSLRISALHTEDDIRRTSLNDLLDVARVLKPNLRRIEDVLSSAKYPEIKRRLASFYKYERVVAKQLETEINRNLYH